MAKRAFGALLLSDNGIGRGKRRKLSLLPGRSKTGLVRDSLKESQNNPRMRNFIFFNRKKAGKDFFTYCQNNNVCRILQRRHRFSGGACAHLTTIPIRLLRERFSPAPFESPLPILLQTPFPERGKTKKKLRKKMRVHDLTWEKISLSFRIWG